MTLGMPLAKQHILDDYLKAAKQDEQSDTVVEGVIYVETDVRYDKPNGDLRSWAAGPIDEIRFLRSIVEGEYGERASQLLVGIVAWAPMDQPTSVLEEWLRLVEGTAGAETWKRIKGFRYLLQAIQNQKDFEKLVESADFINNLKLLGRRGFAFDVGVDQHSGGTWQLEAMAKAMKKAHLGVSDEDQVIFVINHLCKPDFEPHQISSGPDKPLSSFQHWAKAIAAMAECDKTYMKLSGGFSELPEDVLASADCNSIARHMKQWVQYVFEVFGPERVMFGSDWPVCNLRGPAKENSWPTWKDVVASLLDNADVRLDDAAESKVWKETARLAYRL